MAPSSAVRPSSDSRNDNHRGRRRLLPALLGSLAMPLVLACNGIIGISDYARGECAGGGVCADGGLADVTSDAPSDARESVDGARGADPVSWARWPMPNYVLPDAAPLPNRPVLVDGAPGEVEDSITKLVWRTSLESGGAFVSLEKAEDACRSIAPTGKWRVPKRIELVTLLDYGHPKPFIDTERFPGFASVRVWSSSEVRPFNGGPAQRYWTVNFDSGAVETEISRNGAAILCVKGN
jgi:Protein of unknown function (DUF1566)